MIHVPYRSLWDYQLIEISNGIDIGVPTLPLLFDYIPLFGASGVSYVDQVVPNIGVWVLATW